MFAKIGTLSNWNLQDEKVRLVLQLAQTLRAYCICSQISFRKRRVLLTLLQFYPTVNFNDNSTVKLSRGFSLHQENLSACTKIPQLNISVMQFISFLLCCGSPDCFSAHDLTGKLREQTSFFRQGLRCALCFSAVDARHLDHTEQQGRKDREVTLASDQTQQDLPAQQCNLRGALKLSEVHLILE